MGGKSGDNWANLPQYGRYLKRSVTLMMKHMKVEEARAREQGDNYQIEDLDRHLQIVNSLSKVAMTQAKLVDKSDHDQRLENLEKIIENIPLEVLQEAKRKVYA